MIKKIKDDCNIIFKVLKENRKNIQSGLIFIPICFFIVSVYISESYDNKNLTIEQKAYKDDLYIVSVCSALINMSTPLEVKFGFLSTEIETLDRMHKQALMNFTVKNYFGAEMKFIAQCVITPNSHVKFARVGIVGSDKMNDLADKDLILQVENQVKRDLYPSYFKKKEI